MQVWIILMLSHNRLPILLMIFTARILIIRLKMAQSFDFDVTGKLAGHYDIQLIGSFNRKCGCCWSCLRLGTSLADIQKGIAQTSVPGHWKSLRKLMVLKSSSIMP